MFVGTWWSTHVIVNLVKQPLVLVKKDLQRKKISNKRMEKNCNLFCNDTNKKIDTGLVANILTKKKFFQICYNFTFYGRFWPLSETYKVHLLALKVDFWHSFEMWPFFKNIPSSSFAILVAFHLQSFSWTSLGIRYPQ